MQERPVFFRFDFQLAKNESSFEVEINIPPYYLLTIREVQIFIDDSKLEKAWCILDGSGIDDGGLSINLNGQPPRLTSPKLVQYDLSRLETESGPSFALGPPNVYLPSIDNVRLLGFRSPAASMATGSVSITGTLQPYAAPHDPESPVTR